MTEMPDESILREFARDLLGFKANCGLSDEQFAGMLMGGAVEAAKKIGMNKGQIITVVSRTYDSGPANDF